MADELSTSTGVYSYSKSGNSSNNANDSYTVGKNNEAIARALQYGGTTSNAGSGAIKGAAIAATPGKTAVSNGTYKPQSSGGSGSGSGSGSYSSGGGYDPNYLANLYAEYAAQRQRQLEEAYNRSKDNINNAFNESRGLLEQNYNASRDAMNSSYNNSLGKLQDDAAQSLKEAYINRMLSSKNLNQQMSAAGLSGGASESTMASMLNNYGNARNNINTTLNSNIKDLNATRDSNMANILQSYNSNLSNLIQQRANALAQIESALSAGLGDALGQQYSFQTSSGYLNALQNAMNNMNAYKGVATQANNPVAYVNAQQTGVDNIANKTNYELYQELMKQMQGA